MRHALAAVIAATCLAGAWTGCGRNEAPATGDVPDNPSAHRTDSTPVKSSTTKPGVAWTAPKSTDRQVDRDEMVRKIHVDYGLQDDPVLAALAACPRHEFVPEAIAKDAYADTPLPIDYGQLISQPWIVALMTHELQLKPTSRVLEIGTGSAYQAAILSYITPNVFSIEIIKPLAEQAGALLTKLGFDPIQTRCGDGYYGWPEAGPFDGIIVTCAAGQIPPPLIKQLAPGGRMLIPVGQPFQTQSLMLVEKNAEGEVRTKSLSSVRFVPMTSEDGSKKNGK